MRKRCKTPIHYTYQSGKVSSGVQGVIPRGVLNKVVTRGSPSWVSTPYPFKYPVTKKLPLLFTLYWQMVPLSHIWVRTLHNLNWCKCTVFKIRINHKTRMFSRQPKVAPVSHFSLGLFTDRKNRFSYPFVYFRLFTVPYFSVRSLRSSALRYGQPSWMSVKTT